MILHGWKEIASYLGYGRTWVTNKREDLFKQGIVKHSIRGSGKKRKRIVVSTGKWLEFWYTEYLKDQN